MSESVTIPSDSENYDGNNELSSSPPSSSSSPVILYHPPTLWGLMRGAAINLVLPFINGLMLGFGELFAHEIAFRLGWSGTKVSLPPVLHRQTRFAFWALVLSVLAAPPHPLSTEVVGSRHVHFLTSHRSFPCTDPTPGESVPVCRCKATRSAGGDGVARRSTCTLLWSEENKSERISWGTPIEQRRICIYSWQAPSRSVSPRRRKGGYGASSGLMKE